MKRTAISVDEQWQGIRARLEARKAEIDAEIAHYPPPITACDAQFNHLLETRKGLNAELQRLDAATAAGASGNALRDFVKSCAFLDSPDEAKGK